MPELPEVETIRQGLEPALAGRAFERVTIADPRLTRPEPPELVAAALEGERVRALGRRGKYLIVAFESGRHLLIHLRMTGSLHHPAADDGDPHRRAVVRLDDGSDVAYRDVRRFGTWTLLEPGELDEYFEARRLGGEPLERSFTARALARAFAGRRAPLKAALLDQRAAAGKRAAERPSRPLYSTSAPPQAWGTSTSTKRSGGRDSIRFARRASSSAWS